MVGAASSYSRLHVNHHLRGWPTSVAVVWSASKQMAIIDSLFHNYYIPPVVFAISKDPIDGYETRLCVDGKQRLTSIQKFFDGHVRPIVLLIHLALSSPRVSPDAPQIACMTLKTLMFKQLHTHTQIAVQEQKNRGGIQPRQPHARREPRSPHSKSEYSLKKILHAVRPSLRPKTK